MLNRFLLCDGKQEMLDCSIRAASRTFARARGKSQYIHFCSYSINNNYYLKIFFARGLQTLLAEHWRVPYVREGNLMLNTFIFVHTVYNNYF